MAKRRMFTIKIVDSDAFLDMPLSAQALYFHLSMRADDDGFVNNPKKIQRMIGASDDDARILIAKKFILIFESGVIVIKHWKMHNYIQSDRYEPTAYVDEKNKLTVNENKSYSLREPEAVKSLESTECIHNVSKMDAQVRIGKVSIDKVSIDTYAQISDAFNAICMSYPKVTRLTDKRKQKIRSRLESFSQEELEHAFHKAEMSDFLTGRSGKWEKGASFDWIMDSDDHVLKILEGNYDNSDKYDKAMNKIANMFKGDE